MGGAVVAGSPRIGILLSQVREEEKLLLAAFAKRGIEPVRLLDRTLTFELTALDQPPPLDLVLDRCMAHGRGAVALRVFGALGIPTINSIQSVAITDDKVATTLALAGAGVPTLRTAIAFDIDSALETLEWIGYPAVLKPVTGSWGRLLAKVNSPASARSLMEQKRKLGSFHHAVFYIQEYVEKPGRDLRIFVIGDEVVSASYRAAEHWVTNVARGAVSSPCPITPEIAGLSLNAARAVGAEIAGVDLIETAEGLKVIEVNGGAEFKGLMRTTDTDIAGAIANYAIARATMGNDRAELAAPAVNGAS
ncbi:Lysine biosynthesis enzyme LysX [Nitrolancea hollandica Lb]|uniref:Lysine biosynthesis enzyme LysX n=1 Tax=Nitrolancea hollandica Lb TaxID=1129897 RepID=I4EHR9_9BACT|nr:Lysine biosynthesis enzyme LysX [Nitrolancea hollandica Lb]